MTTYYIILGYLLVSYCTCLIYVLENRYVGLKPEDYKSKEWGVIMLISALWSLFLVFALVGYVIDVLDDASIPSRIYRTFVKERRLSNDKTVIDRQTD